MGLTGSELAIILKTWVHSPVPKNQTEPIKQTTSHASKTAWAKEETQLLVDLSEVRKKVYKGIF